VTPSRRENSGPRLEIVFRALLWIEQGNPQVQIVYPVHLNANEREPVMRILRRSERIDLLDPVPYAAFAQLTKHAYLILRTPAESRTRRQRWAR